MITSFCPKRGQELLECMDGITPDLTAIQENETALTTIGSSNDKQYPRITEKIPLKCWRAWRRLDSCLIKKTDGVS